MDTGGVSFLQKKRTNTMHAIQTNPSSSHLKESWRELVIGKRQGAKHH